jgi:hypothetical protein
MMELKSTIADLQHKQTSKRLTLFAQAGYFGGLRSERGAEK